MSIHSLFKTERMKIYDEAKTLCSESLNTMDREPFVLKARLRFSFIGKMDRKEFEHHLADLITEKALAMNRFQNLDYITIANPDYSD